MKLLEILEQNNSFESQPIEGILINAKKPWNELERKEIIKQTNAFVQDKLNNLIDDAAKHAVNDAVDKGAKLLRNEHYISFWPLNNEFKISTDKEWKKKLKGVDLDKKQHRELVSAYLNALVINNGTDEAKKTAYNDLVIFIHELDQLEKNYQTDLNSTENAWVTKKDLRQLRKALQKDFNLDNDKKWFDEGVIKKGKEVKWVVVNERTTEKEKVRENQIQEKLNSEVDAFLGWKIETRGYTMSRPKDGNVAVIKSGDDVTGYTVDVEVKEWDVSLWKLTLTLDQTKQNVTKQEWELTTATHTYEVAINSSNQLTITKEVIEVEEDEPDDMYVDKPKLSENWYEINESELNDVVAKLNNLITNKYTTIKEKPLKEWGVWGTNYIGKHTYNNKVVDPDTSFIQNILRYCAWKYIWNEQFWIESEKLKKIEDGKFWKTTFESINLLQTFLNEHVSANLGNADWLAWHHTLTAIKDNIKKFKQTSS